jgi:hypothetical protein
VSLFKRENYRIFWEYIKCVFPPLTYVVGFIMYLISRTYHLCEKRKYTFNVFPKYPIITHSKVTTKNKVDRDRMDGQKVKSKKEKLIGYSCKCRLRVYKVIDLCNLFCDPMGERDQSLSKSMVDLLTFICIEHNPSSHW